MGLTWGERGSTPGTDEELDVVAGQLDTAIRYADNHVFRELGSYGATSLPAGYKCCGAKQIRTPDLVSAPNSVSGCSAQRSSDVGNDRRCAVLRSFFTPSSTDSLTIEP
jgi:hypothetical protein